MYFFMYSDSGKSVQQVCLFHWHLCGVMLVLVVDFIVLYILQQMTRFDLLVLYILQQMTCFQSVARYPFSHYLQQYSVIFLLIVYCFPDNSCSAMSSHHGCLKLACSFSHFHPCCQEMQIHISSFLKFLLG